jgi:CheY-like chemotaxis protein
MAMAHKTINKPNPSTEKRQPQAEPIRRQVRVAIFEDSPEVNLAYHDCFTSFADAVVVSSKPVLSTDDAIEIFRALRPDVVITDLSLTDGNFEGFEILKRIKEISPETPVGLSTSSYHPKKDDEINREIRRHGFDMLFQKHDLASMCDFIASFSS